MGIREMIREFLSKFGKGAGLPEFPLFPDSPPPKPDDKRAREIEREQRLIKARLDRLELQQRLAEGRYRDAPGRDDE